jgi:hypothetical protein
MVIAELLPASCVSVRMWPWFENFATTYAASRDVGERNVMRGNYLSP